MDRKKINKIYQEDLDSFPNFETYIHELKTLNKSDFSQLTERDVYDKYFDFAKILPTSFGMLDTEKFNSHKFYRVRLKKDIGDKEDITLKQTFSFPPTSILKKNGRANLKYKSVFYCSNNPNGAIIESKPEIGDEGYLSVWKGMSKRSIKAGICLPNDLPEENVWNLMAKDSFEYIRETLPKETKDKFKHFESLYSFIANRFITETKPYPLTAMISNELLYGELWRDFIIYPSVLARTKICNMAFHPNSVNENLILEKIIKFKIVDKKDKQFKFQLGKVGHYENTKLIWKNRTESENELFEREKNV
ncbi:hypothetical protein [Aquimarina agarilytica]|uniref:hypothetical protein n=1 Tax=Aquimarina agarilytica TaxID=1087449 RepID=UPI0002888BBB|nr:hypothetical protein [Aquimarina agarilytica]